MALGTFFHRSKDGSETDVTESVQCMYDLVIGSMDWGSGFLTAEDAEPVVKVAELGGFPDSERAREYVDAKRHAEETMVFLSEHTTGVYPAAYCSTDVYQPGPGGRGWVDLRGRHEHAWSSVGRCMWRGCDVKRDG